MKQCNNYLILMVPCYQYKQNRNVNIIMIKIMTMMILMMMMITIVIIAVMIMMIKMILIIAVVIVINSPFQPGDFSTESTTESICIYTKEYVSCPKSCADIYVKLFVSR